MRRCVHCKALRSRPRRLLVITPAPTTAPDTSDLRDDSADERTTPTTPVPNQPDSVAPQEDRQPNHRRRTPRPYKMVCLPEPLLPTPRRTNKETSSHRRKTNWRTMAFIGTRSTVSSGPKMEFSLRAYQSRVGLAVTGRLDLATLAALELLPGAHTPVYALVVPCRYVGNRRCGANGSDLRLSIFVKIDRPRITISDSRNEPIAIQRRSCRRKFGPQLVAASGRCHPRSRDWRGEISYMVPTACFCRPFVFSHRA